MLFCAAAALLVVADDHATGAADAATPERRLSMMGVNLASGEFAPEGLPGTHGKDYKYPTARTAAPFLQMGMNTVRVPFRWERLQRSPFGDLDQKELARLDRSIAQLAGFETIILDLHNYGRYHGARVDTGEGSAMLADFWSRMARHYGGRPNIAFGLMNEPYDIPAREWGSVADRSVRAIRSAGARNLLLVPGTRWTGAHSWHDGGRESNAAAFRDFTDPANNFVFELHQYLDANSSGKSQRCAGEKVGARRLAGVTKWLRERKQKALLAEFGASADPTCLAALDEMLSHMARNSDVWAGWTYWAGGDWWGDYGYSIQPGRDGTEKPQVRILKRYLAKR